MSNYFDVTVSGLSFEDVVQFLEEELRKEGFNVITDINIKETFSTMLGVSFRKYSIINAYNPTYTYRALHAHDKAGLFLPSSFVVQETEKGEVEVTGIDPIPAMKPAECDDLILVANQIQRKIRHVLKAIQYGNFNV
ncbi:MAG: DUF302 domain-containing protein [Balneola sp.]